LLPVATPWGLSAQNIWLAPNQLLLSTFSDQHNEAITVDSAYYGPVINKVPESTGTLPADDLQHRLSLSQLWKSTAQVNIPDLLGIIWLIGTVFMLFYTVICYFVFQRSLRKTCCEIRQPELLRLYREVGEALNIKKLPALYESSAINAPLQIGFLYPFLLLPQRLTVQQNTDDLRYFLLHELIHYRRHDVLYKWTMQVCVCLHWFNPFIYIMRHELNTLCELSCDTSVLRKLEFRERKDYGDMLLKAIEIEHIAKRLLSFGVTWGNEKKILKDRFANITAFRKHRKPLWLLMVALALFLGAFSVAAGPVTDFAAAGNDTPAAGFNGKIAIIANPLEPLDEERHTVEALVAKYGAENILFLTLPSNSTEESELTVSAIRQIAADSDVKILIINQTAIDTNAAFGELLMNRDDIFIIYCAPGGELPDVTARADLVLSFNYYLSAEAMVRQAQKMGVKKLAYYSFPRHMSFLLLSRYCDLVKEICEKTDIEFIYLTAPDPADAGSACTQQFILEDVPNQVEIHGKDTAFFGTNCSMQSALVEAVVKAGAIYVQPCCPSPYRGIPQALGIDGKGSNGAYDSLCAQTPGEINSEISKIISEKNMTGRISNYALPNSMLFTFAAVEYGIKWMNNEVPKGNIDLKALQQLMADCSAEYAGVEKLSVTCTPLSQNGSLYRNFFLILQDYLVY
jgi:beta-lactamase regulating signal transducer with metallopeptidase domain